MNDIYTQFAKGDFSSLANSFVQAGFLVEQPCAGVIQICAVKSNIERIRLLISVGVHGDETAPIEMMASLLEQLSNTPESLAVDLMIVVGNLQAITEAKRVIDVDLNRLFTPNRTLFNDSKEAQRADQLMQIVTPFFDGHQHKWHLDLHTTIRASVYSTFAVIPGKKNSAFINWLGAAGIKAVVLNPQPPVTSFTTFSSFTCAHLGAVSCTAELGRIGESGKNNLSRFVVTHNAIDALLRSGIAGQTKKNEASPVVFRVVQELIKHSDAFQFTFDSSVKNFTQFDSGAILATDGEIIYSVGAAPEYVLFPNPNVYVGLRAGLMIVTI